MDEAVINAIYEAALEPDHWEPLLARLSRKHGAAAVYLGQASPRKFGDGDIWSHGLDRSGWRDVPEDDQGVDRSSVLAAHLGSPLRALIDRRSLVEDGAIDRHPLAVTFLTSNGLFHAVLSVVQRDAEVTSSFWMGRSRLDPFESMEFHQVEALVPHLGQAMQTHRTLRRAAGEMRTFRGALDLVNRGVALIDRDLFIAYANPATERIFEAGRGVVRRLNRLGLSSWRHQRELEKSARRLTDAGDHRGAEIAAPIATGERGCSLTLAPALGGGKTELAPKARIIVFITDELPTVHDPTMEWVAVQFSLTPTEARIAALAARPMRVATIAASLGVSVNTVKFHLKSVYDKLGVRTQAELVRALLVRAL